MVWGTSVKLPAGKKIRAPNGKMMTEAELGNYVKNALAAGEKGKLAAVLNTLHDEGHSGSYNASQQFIDVVGANEKTGIVPDSVAAAGPAAVAAHVAEHNMGPSGTTQSLSLIHISEPTRPY